MSEVGGSLMSLLFFGWLGKFVVSEMRAAGTLVRVFWLTIGAASIGFTGVFLYAAGQPNW